jgi:hypothetical protein
MSGRLVVLRSGSAAVFVVAAVFLSVVSSALAAKGGSHGGGSSGPVGYDVSYPQCGARLPSALFGIVGVNGGIVFSANPCLGTGDGASELAWAELYDGSGGAMLYANTGDPGPALSKHWPIGQTAPEFCDPSQPDSSACSYDYGWNAAADSYRDAVNAYVQIGELAVGATQTPRPNPWWLDVESANSWEATPANNVAELQGEVAYLQSQGVSSIGFYANASDWASITGATTVFASFPSWQPGAGTQTTAQSYCGKAGVNGGPITISQYRANGLDADLRC